MPVTAIDTVDFVASTDNGLSQHIFHGHGGFPVFFFAPNAY